MTRRRTKTAAPALFELPATSAPGARREADHPEEWFPTPASVVRALQREVILPGGRWLEPCAGDGSLVRPFAHRYGEIVWDLVELRPTAGDRLRFERSAVVHHVECPRDYLTRPMPLEQYDVAIANPPFSLAARFIGKMLKEARHVVVLLKLSFLASASRNEFMRRCTPDVYVLPQRPSFDGRGTDSADYCWCHWAPHRATGAARIVVLPVSGPAQLGLEDARVLRRLPTRRRG